MNDDLELKDLDSYTGSANSYKIGRLILASVTDGVSYIMKNGYSWFVTDALSVIEIKFRNEEFITVELKINKEKKTADMIITGDNNNEVYKQHYKYTDAKRDLKLFYRNNLLMLSSEYEKLKPIFP